jgi:hypothetical protein
MLSIAEMDNQAGETTSGWTMISTIQSRSIDPGQQPGRRGQNFSGATVAAYGIDRFPQRS